MTPSVWVEYGLYILTLTHSLFPVTADAQTSAPAWPNLSSVCVSARQYTAEPPALRTWAQEGDAHSEGRSDRRCVLRNVMDFITFLDPVVRHVKAKVKVNFVVRPTVQS